jgi:arabinofuranosyltransferase
LTRGAKAIAFVPAVMIAIAGWSHRWMNEDAYINLRVVDQVFAGHGPVFNAGERIEAATSPLWLGVLVVGRFLFGLFVRDEWIAVIASLCAAVAAFVVAGIATLRVHRSDNGVVLPVGLLLVASITAVWDFSTSGLEMGLVWLWLASSWLVLVSAARAEEVTGRRRTAGAVVLGLAPLIRPELGLMMLCFVVAWFLLVHPRRVVRDLVAMFALPVVYQIFRMGYYASLVPNTALAKDAGGLHAGQGWNYAFDLIDSYKLWLSAVLVVAALAVRRIGRRDRPLAIATGAMLGAGVLDALYIIAVGGDYMHGRLLLPAVFALGLPASICVQPRRVASVVVAAGATAWALVTVVAFRPPPIGDVFGVSPVSDWRAVSGAKVVLDDSALGLNGHEAAAAYARGVRGYYGIIDKVPVAAADPNAFVLTLGSVGVPAYDAGKNVWVIDIGGLAEPLAARTSPVAGRPAGHRKQVDYAWYDARFAAPTPNDSVEVLAARHALQCGSLHELIGAVDDDLTPARFLENIWDSFSLTRLHVPASPLEGERRFCG